MGLNSSLEPSRVETLLELETEGKVRDIQSKGATQPTSARGRPHESMRKMRAVSMSKDWLPARKWDLSPTPIRK